MPKETFFNLPDEKRKRIMDSTYRLLQENRYSDVSINMIIKNAEIPRGSFYQYFDDKDDLVRYMFSDIRKEMGTVVTDCLNEGKCLLDVAEDILESMSRIMEKDDIRKVFANIMSDASIVEMFVLDLTEDENILIEELKKHVVRDELRLKSDYEIEQMLRLGLGMFEFTAGEIFMNIDRKDEIIESFKVRADIIAYGAVKDRKDS